MALPFVSSLFLSFWIVFFSLYTAVQFPSNCVPFHREYPFTLDVPSACQSSIIYASILVVFASCHLCLSVVSLYIHFTILPSVGIELMRTNVWGQSEVNGLMEESRILCHVVCLHFPTFRWHYSVCGVYFKNVAFPPHQMTLSAPMFRNVCLPR